MTATCAPGAKHCTLRCLFTGTACVDRFGKPFKSLLRVEHWFGGTTCRKVLWRAVRGEWVEVSTSTSARVLAGKFGTGLHVVTIAGVDPNGIVEIPLELAPIDGVMFA